MGRACDIVFVQGDNALDHLPGVRDELARRGLTSTRRDEPYVAPRIEPGTKVVVTTLTSPRCMMALRQAAEVNARTALLLDGITDWRNTLVNPRQTEHYLRPAGVDLVLCSGLSDARVLRSLGNHAAPTGLPRIDEAFRDVDHAQRLADRRTGPVLVATANTPAFGLDERQRLVAALAELRDEASYRGVDLAWRLTDGLDDELGVKSDQGSLKELFSRVRATVCTPSTLMVESMRAGVPTALLHAEATPLWHAAAWVWQPSELEPVSDPLGVPAPPAGMARWVDSASRLLRQLSMPTSEQRRRQEECLMWLDASSRGARAAELVAEALGDLAKRAPCKPVGFRGDRDRGRVVSILSCEGEGFERAAHRQHRLDKAFADAGVRSDVVVVVWGDAGERRARRALPDATVCRLGEREAWDWNAARLHDAIGTTPEAMCVHVADTPRLVGLELAMGVPIVAVAHGVDAAFDGWHSAWPWCEALTLDDSVHGRIARHAGGRTVTSIPESRKELAEVLGALVERCRTDVPRVGRMTPNLERLPARVPRCDGRRRVVSLVAFEESPVGGVTSFSLRLADAMARRPELGYDVHTLFVAWDAASASRAHGMLGERASLCVLDRSRPMHRVLEHLREAVELCEPDLLLPNYTDANLMVAAQLRHAGVRAVGIGHTDDDWYRELLLESEWDGAVAVSDSIRAWLEPLAGHRPCETIVYGVPVADEPRQRVGVGRLEIAYIGRVVQPQKRVMDLVPVLRELAALGVAARFHVVGDGDALDLLRRAMGAESLPGIDVQFHGAQDADWVGSFLKTIDVSLLVSEAEGTSISMLEAMGAGVVPAVTRVSSGTDEWVEHGISGVVAPIGDAKTMARHLAWLAEDHDRLAKLGAEAHRRVEATQSTVRMAERYAELFDRVFSQPMDLPPSVAGLSPIEPLRWASCEAGDAESELRWAKQWLGEAGFTRVASRPGERGDVVYVPTGASEWPEIESGVPVVRSGNRAGRDDLVPHVERLFAEGCSRIAIYGLGRHTQWRAGVFDREDLPVVGVVDDRPPPSGEAFGLPVVTLADAVDRLRVDGVLISSDAWEAEMYDRAKSLESSGVRVRRIYGERLQAAMV